VTELRITVYGTPAPQGSKNARAIYRGRGAERQFTGHVAVSESSKKVKPWRQNVATAARNAMGAAGRWEQYDEPVEVSLVLLFERPKYHFGTGRNAHILKPDAPTYVPVYPDLDKLVRSTLDALGSKTGAGVVRNDSQIVRFIEPFEKRYVSPGEQPGAYILVRPLTPSIPVPAAGTSSSVDPSPAGTGAATPTAAGTAPSPDPGALF
jgi:Holliday junction resolvase RusA-like endonuclease